jgi:hypothetical protein
MSTNRRPAPEGVYGADLNTMLEVLAHLLTWSSALRVAGRVEDGEERAYRLHSAAAADRCTQLAPGEEKYLVDAEERAALLVVWDHRGGLPWAGRSERGYVREQYDRWLSENPHTNPLAPGLEWSA